MFKCIVILAALLCGSAQAAEPIPLPHCWPLKDGQLDNINFGYVKDVGWWIAGKCPDGSPLSAWVTVEYVKNYVKMAPVIVEFATSSDLAIMWRRFVVDDGTSAKTKPLKAAADAYLATVTTKK